MFIGATAAFSERIFLAIASDLSISVYFSKGDFCHA